MSYLATLTCQDGEYYDKAGVCLGTWDDALGSVLGFCGCGATEAALRYVLRILRAVNMKHENSADFNSFSAWYKVDYRPAIDAIFHGDEGAEYLAYYLLDDKGLLEHGGSVPGWLTDLGKSVLADLESHAEALQEQT